MAGQDFTAVRTYTISGKVSGAISSGVNVSLSGDGSATTTTGGDGSYTFSGWPSGSYTVTPSQAGYKFSPASRSVDVSGGDATAADFSMAVADAALTLDRLDLASTVATIDGEAVAYTTVLTNWTGGTLGVGL